MKTFDYLGYNVTVSDSGYIIKLDGNIVETWSEDGCTVADYEILVREVIDSMDYDDWCDS